jgi:hypothetical protein
MLSKPMFKAGLLTLLLVVAFIAGWESYWRSQGFTPTFNDDKALWAVKRAEAYTPRSTVFIGSSRIKFDLDIPTWEKLTGEDAVQLALVGTSPRLLLTDLANDENFRGKLVIDIIEVLFFAQIPPFHKSAKEAVAFYRKQTPSEKLSSQINLALESKLTFLEERRFSLTELLNELAIPNRPGVFSMPAFPKTFEWTTYDRQTYMSDLFLSNPKDINRQTGIWSSLIMGTKTPPISGDALQAVLDEVRVNVDKIRARGGRVVFVRTPSTGPMGEGEKMAYPRDKYWDQLLAYTKAPGIHFSDYPETASLICPEWSHLSPKDAIRYTHHLVKVLREKDWFSPSVAAL